MAFNRSSATTIWIILLVFFPGRVFANSVYFEFTNEDQGIFQTIGNGFFGVDDSDGNYSQGFYFSYTMDWHARQKLSFSVEQDIYTPAGVNKNKDQAVIGDRPFAGFLGIGGNYIRRDEKWVQRAGIKLGVVGPDAMGEEVQNVLHKNGVGNDGYKGWNDQVNNRYGLIGCYNAAWRFQTTYGGIQAEFSPHVALTLGNLIANERIGMTVRIGNHLDQDYGPAPFSILSGGEFLTDYVGFSWSLFAGIEGRHIRRNYILEGRTNLTHIQNVIMDNEVTDKKIGADIKWKGITCSITFVERSPEFSGQDEQQFLRIGVGIDL